MIDLTWAWARRPVVAAYLLVGVGACSDDGLTPEQAGSSAGGTSGGVQGTSSVNTSATVTDTAEGSGDDGGPPNEDTGGGTTGDGGGDPTTGAGTGTSDATGPGDDAGSTGAPGSTGEDVPPCVLSDDCECDPTEVSCEALPPECPPGTVPEVDPVAMCWTFECVPAEGCLTVPDCGACGDDLACVEVVELGGIGLVCEPIPPVCMDGPACACMPDACPMAYDCLDMPPQSEADLACICEVC